MNTEQGMHTMFRTILALVLSVIFLPSTLTVVGLTVAASTLAVEHAVEDDTEAPAPVVDVEVVIERDAYTVTEAPLPEALPLEATCPEGYAMAEDMSCVPSSFWDASPTIQEDDPAWDCRTMGNRDCGVEIEGTWYIVSFDEAGQPVAVTPRDL